MNITRRLTPLTLIAATLAACFLVQSAQAETTVLRLEPVHVTAKRVPAVPVTVVQLPRVAVTAARVQPQAVQVVRLAAVEITARRSGVAHVGHRVGAEVGPLKVSQHAAGRIGG